MLWCFDVQGLFVFYSVLELSFPPKFRFSLLRNFWNKRIRRVFFFFEKGLRTRRLRSLGTRACDQVSRGNRSLRNASSRPSHAGQVTAAGPETVSGAQFPGVEPELLIGRIQPMIGRLN